MNPPHRGVTIGTIVALVVTNVLCLLVGGFIFRGMTAVAKLGGSPEIVLLLTPPGRPVVMLRRKSVYTGTILFTVNPDDLVIVNGAVCQETIC